MSKLHIFLNSIVFTGKYKMGKLLKIEKCGSKNTRINNEQIL